jgi:hypothetical protein
MNVGIFGSRTLNDQRVKIEILAQLKKYGATKVITTQEPRGVCEVAQLVAKELGMPLQLHFLNFKYLRGAFEHRSKEVIAAADKFIVIHDGVSRGTANELALVKKSRKEYCYIVLEPDELARDIGFNVDESWDKPPHKGKNAEAELFGVPLI